MQQKIHHGYFLLFIIFSILILNGSCKKKSSEPAPEIGKTYKGGLVFYIDNSGLHGLVAAPSDLGAGSAWGCIGAAINGADGTTIGTGNQNTIDITNNCQEAGNAAKLCSDFTLDGFSDWYLPSKDELNLMYQQRSTIGGFSKDTYWSSSEFSATHAWLQSFDTGAQYNTKKDYGTSLRAIRAF